MRNLIFTVALTCISRFFILRDWLLRRVKVDFDASGPPVSVARHAIQSGANLLDAQCVQPAGRATKAVVLLCHGIGETVDHWLAAQRLLAEHDVASLVFNYSGYGRSSGHIDAAQCERDTVAAFQHLQQLMPSQPITLLGYSLGSGIATAVLAKVPAQRLVLCAAFTSLRKAAGRTVPPPLPRLLPDIWDTETALRRCPVPVLIVQGERDRLFPPRMARALAAACASRCELRIMPVVSHNAPMYDPQPSYWALIASWIKSRD
jgi:pimeloyl-ACP methyl ester carboxylesterase